MSTPVALGPILPVAGIVFGVGGLVTLAFRTSLTWYHVPSIVLILLAMTAGISTATGAISLDREVEKTDYSVGECADPQATPSGDPDGPEPTVVDDPNRLEFSSLSADGKDVFRAALQADGVYTTTTRPAEFIYQGDTGTALNYIQYEGECYALHADSRGGLGAGLFMSIVVPTGVFLTVVLLALGLGSLLAGWFKIPTSILAGIALPIVWPGLVSWPSLAVLVAFSPATILLTWVSLRTIETRSSRTFQERMDA
jgi:hypothetical protein